MIVTGDPIELPRKLHSATVDYECELAVVLGKACKNVPAEKALEYVLGYTCGNDVSARDWQKDYGGSQWCRGKTFDTFCYCVQQHAEDTGSLSFELGPQFFHGSTVLL